MNEKSCATLWNQAIEAGLEAARMATGRCTYVLNVHSGMLIDVIPDDAPGHCHLVLEGGNDFSRWLVRNKIASKLSRDRISISDRSGTGLAVASEMCAVAIATVLEDADIVVLAVEPARHL